MTSLLTSSSLIHLLILLMSSLLITAFCLLIKLTSSSLIPDSSNRNTDVIIPLALKLPADNIGYPRMSASGESSTTMHRLLHASGSYPIPPPNDPKTNQCNQDLGLIHSTNGNHLESPNEGSSIDHQFLLAEPQGSLAFMVQVSQIWARREAGAEPAVVYVFIEGQRFRVIVVFDFCQICIQIH
ncbi:histone-lysine N-methyltransferase ASHH3-like [Dorcoceras hygrometricum]|uniref:Histone-lysine N-methyltransferase ASHH3-like n=1 Tax=Dorcoceras hygrometricum TaxID=472368 RepID=A0A2Z7CEI0_9LAMI|nr:histone-lysine N-methyltransferase ASHH3-like [Dorcoceras hygrometricum]